MPYNSIDELPERVKDHLPTHAQHIFREAFNHAYDLYGAQGRNPEVTAFRVAWAAVKKKYHKDDKTGNWEEDEPGYKMEEETVEDLNRRAKSRSASKNSRNKAKVRSKSASVSKKSPVSKKIKKRSVKSPKSSLKKTIKRRRSSYN